MFYDEWPLQGHTQGRRKTLQQMPGRGILEERFVWAARILP